MAGGAGMVGSRELVSGITGASYPAERLHQLRGRTPPRCRSPARDTDWMMRLIDVHPDGRCTLLCDGVIRARCRDPKHRGAFNASTLSDIEPDRVYEYTLAFWRGTGNVFGKGHRIRVEVSSSFFPYSLPNPGTGEDNVGLQTRRVKAKQKGLHDARHPSHVVLPVMPARR
jgi:uncharacterized protein